MERQTRIISGADLRVQGSQGDDSALIVTGRAVAYNHLSEYGVPFAGAREKIRCGAFAASLRSDQDVLMDYNHSRDSLPLATTKNGTLKLTDLADGLHFVLQLNPRVQMHKDVHELVRSGTLNKCSFEFGVLPSDDTWSEEVGTDDEDRGVHFRLRTVNRGELYGLSLVNSPAYGGSATYAGARALCVAYSFDSLTRHDAGWEALRMRAEKMVDDYHRQRAKELEQEIRWQRGRRDL